MSDNDSLFARIKRSTLFCSTLLPKGAAQCWNKNFAVERTVAIDRDTFPQLDRRSTGPRTTRSEGEYSAQCVSLLTVSACRKTYQALLGAFAPAYMGLAGQGLWRKVSTSCWSRDFCPRICWSGMLDIDWVSECPMRIQRALLTAWTWEPSGSTVVRPSTCPVSFKPSPPRHRHTSQ